MHADNRKKGVLILLKVPANRLYDTTITAKAKYSINITEHQDKFFYVYSFMEIRVFCLSME